MNGVHKGKHGLFLALRCPTNWKSAEIRSRPLQPERIRNRAFPTVAAEDREGLTESPALSKVGKSQHN